jgi:hypothetical protein
MQLARVHPWAQNANMTSRRQFIGLIPASLFLATSGVKHMAPGATRLSNHPEPRPGITAAKVLTRDKLGDHKDAAPVFDMVREMPQVIDGIRCQCGCASLESKYSLLSCFEDEGMAGHCEVCQNEGRLAYRLHKEGKSLKEIRAAIDAKFG